MAFSTGLPGRMKLNFVPLLYAHPTGRNQEPSFGGLNRHGKLKYSWAVGLGPFKIAGQ